MATSTLTFYSSEIAPNMNCVVDNIATYLNNVPKQVVENFQYQPIAKNLRIRIDKNQLNYPKNLYNYIGIKNSDSDKTFYYFIVGEPNWFSANTIEYSLLLDTVNTFVNDLNWTKLTHITRQHKDRYHNDKTTTLGVVTITRKIDDFDEGINPVKYLTSSTRVTSKISTDWYLIYKNKSQITADTTVPIDCFCCASKSVNLTVSASATGIYFDNYNKFDLICAFSKDNAEFKTTINGVQYTIGADSEYKGIAFWKGAINQALLLKDSNCKLIANVGSSALTDVNATIKLRTINYQLDPTPESVYSYTSLLGIVESQNYIESTVGTTSAVLNPFSTVNKTDTQIIKIIKMPYAPFEINLVDERMTIPAGWTYTNGFLKLNNLDTEFLTTLISPTLLGMRQTILKSTLDNYKSLQHSSAYESKLYNSAFHTQKYVYDNFDKEIQLERYSPNLYTSHEVTIKFKQSNNISSNSLFDFSFSKGVYHNVSLYDQYLSVNRQNEVALYNSEYLNYIRSGYNYDKKAFQRQQIANWIGTGISTATGVLSTLTKGPVGVAAGISFISNAISSTVSNLFNSMNGEAAIQQKLVEYQNRPASVSNTTDLNLLSYYNGNRLLDVREDISDDVKNGVYNLLRLTGYACDEYATPQVNSRVWYNYIQCTPNVDVQSWKYGKELLDDIISRYETGVTYYHNVDGVYDFQQLRENFETWLVSST